LRAYQASTGSAKDVDMMLPIVARASPARPSAGNEPVPAQESLSWNRAASPVRAFKLAR
jgi:hypothetical protein